jgi:D-3-phosphoglycerate dehydrogenase / 2-oxoglutarate reductase
MAKYKILMTDSIYADQGIERDRLAAIDAGLVLAPSADEESLAALAGDADGILVTYAEVTARVIQAAAKCRIIARTGIGVNNIDIEAANAKGIMVANVPDYCIAEVADHTLALMLTCLRKTAFLSAAVKHGSWNMNLARPVPRLNSLTAGLFGLGHIAQAVVGRLQVFGLKVQAYDPYVADEVFGRLGVVRVQSLVELAAAADVLSLHAPLTKDTRGIINGDIFRQMKRTAILINTSRGPVVNEIDLCQAIATGLIAGCGLDVMATEPGDLHSPLLQHDNVIITPHVAFYSEGSDIELREKSTSQIILALTEGQPKYWVNRK